MRLLLILNESPAGDHRDVRYSLKQLVENGFLIDFRIYPFLAYRDQGRSDLQISDGIYETAKTFLPDIVLWSHTGTLKVTEDLIENLRKLPTSPAIGYRDADIYQSFYKPLPKEVVVLSKQCDVSFWPGYSKTIEKLKKSGCKDIRYVPLTTDEENFSRLRKNQDFKYDVVMVGNLVKSKIPFKTFPGTKFREQIAEYFHKQLGARFAVFGMGWNDNLTNGKVAFHQQNEVYHKSRLVLGVNNLHADYYFSNRLPIALSSGVLVIHNYERGVEQLFNGLDYPYFFKDAREAWQITRDLLERPQQELDALALNYRRFIMERLSMTKILKYMIEVLKDYKQQPDDQAKPVRDNPWISLARF